MPKLPDKKYLPRHVGIIMDGNGRWAQKQGLPRTEGHKQGAKVFRKISDYAYKIGIPYVTFYAFSTENWKRPVDEIDTLMHIFQEYLLIAEESKEKNEKRGYCLRFIGDTGAIPKELVNLMDETEQRITEKTRTVINIAINYGGRQEILKSVRELAEKASKGLIDPQKITEKDFEKGLFTAGMPDADLIIRPSGECRMSNFLTWQSAYSELWFSEIPWPDFTTDDFDTALLEYVRRNRSFGAV
ncbi:MAG: polyprenyl diphosphate synthase [Oscillospiraceae bacterium]